MSANRVITSHGELEDAGQVSHEQLDQYVNQTTWLVASGSPNTIPPGARRLAAGPGISLFDEGPGNGLVIQVSGSVTSDNHKLLSQLIHFIEGPGDGFGLSPYRERIGFPFVERLTWWDSPLKLRKVFQTELTRSLGSYLVASMSYKLYDQASNLVITAIDAITYFSGVFESTRTRTFA